MRKAMSYLKMKAEEILNVNEMENGGLSDGVDEINKMLEEQELQDKADAKD